MFDILYLLVFMTIFLSGLCFLPIATWFVFRICGITKLSLKQWLDMV